MNRILLLFLDRMHDTHPLSQWLMTHYQTMIPNCVEEHRSSEVCQQNIAYLRDQPFDLCILDGMALNQLRQQVQARKEAEKPGFLPFLLVTSSQEAVKLDKQLWQSIDELVVTPIKKPELQMRVEMLLRSRRLSSALLSANDEITSLKDFKSRFISMASHELRNPLSAILFSTQLLQKYSEQLPPQQKRKYFDLIQERVEYMKQMLDDVLIISRAEVGKLEFNPSPIDLKLLCRNILEEMELSASDRHTLTFASYGECNHLCLDAKLIHHILSNLLNNAIKYSPDGGAVRLDVSCRNEQVICRVQDEGIGIPLEDQILLFESFHRASNVGKIIGTGLGLSIVKQCVELHGGEIAVDSEVGTGTTFTVTLPISGATTLSERLERQGTQEKARENFPKNHFPAEGYRSGI